MISIMDFPFDVLKIETMLEKANKSLELTHNREVLNENDLQGYSVYAKQRFGAKQLKLRMLGLII